MTRDILGTPLGRRLADRRRLAVILSALTMTIEAGFLPSLILAWPWRAWIALAAIIFHAGIGATTGISFWHLWWLYPALYGPLPRRRTRN